MRPPACNSSHRLHVDVAQCQSRRLVSGRRALDSLRRLHFAGLGHWLVVSLPSCSNGVRFSDLAPFFAGIVQLAERGLAKSEVPGSLPGARSIFQFGSLAHLGERLICTQEAVGS